MAQTNETWEIETGHRKILRYEDGTYSAAYATCGYAKVVGSERTASPEDGTLQYSYDNETWASYPSGGIASATVYGNGGTVHFRLVVDKNTVLKASTVVASYDESTAVSVPSYVNGSTNLSIGNAIAVASNFINIELLKTVDGEDVTMDSHTVTIQHTAASTDYSLTVTPTSLVKSSSNSWQDFTQMVIRVAKKIGSGDWTQAGSEDVGVFYRVNDDGTPVKVTLENGSATVSASSIEATTAMRIEVFITPGKADDPVIRSVTVTVIRNASSVAGHTGRFYYYDGEWDANKDYYMKDTQAPYVKRHCTLDGVEDDYFFMLDFGGKEPENPMSYDDEPEDTENADNPWTRMMSSFQYYIAKAFFGENAQFGSFIINGDWMLSTKGTTLGNIEHGEQPYLYFDPLFVTGKSKRLIERRWIKNTASQTIITGLNRRAGKRYAVSLTGRCLSQSATLTVQITGSETTALTITGTARQTQTVAIEPSSDGTFSIAVLSSIAAGCYIESLDITADFTTFTPNFAVDGLTGEVYMNNAHIQGDVTASGLIAGDGAFTTEISPGVTTWRSVSNPLSYITIGVDANGMFFKMTDNSGNLIWDISKNGNGKVVDTWGTVNLKKLSAAPASANVNEFINVSNEDTTTFYVLNGKVYEQPRSNSAAIADGYYVRANNGVFMRDMITGKYVVPVFHYVSGELAETVDFEFSI